MHELGIQNQCIFIAVYASFILLCAATMTSQQTGSLGATVTTSYLCTLCDSEINEVWQIYTRYIVLYTRYIPFLYSICLVYAKHRTKIIMSYDDLWRIHVVTMSQILCTCSVPVMLRFMPVIRQVYITINRNVTSTEQVHKGLVSRKGSLGEIKFGAKQVLIHFHD